ncbi:MAG: DUF2383 domain-containing protein [Paracoccaceae bacterium]
MNESTYTVYAEHTVVGGLSELATTLSDVIRGYEEMEKRAEAELLPAVQALKARHESDAAEILELLEETGGRPENTGSMMGVVHEAVATARDWFGGLDGSALDAIIDGEENVLEQYKSALPHVHAQPEIHDVVVRQRDALESEIETLKAQQDS